MSTLLTVHNVHHASERSASAWTPEHLRIGRSPIMISITPATVLVDITGVALQLQRFMTRYERSWPCPHTGHLANDAASTVARLAGIQKGLRLLLLSYPLQLLSTSQLHTISLYTPMFNMHIPLEALQHCSPLQGIFTGHILYSARRPANHPRPGLRPRLWFWLRCAEPNQLFEHLP
jgi:hypothetical protein